MTQQDLVKVILIEGIWQDVSKTKEAVSQHYKHSIGSGTFHLQHESEEYFEVARLSVLQKIQSYKHHVETIRAGIPSYGTEQMVNNAADRVLTKERIRQLCYETCIDGIGNIYSDPYNVRFFLTLHRIKGDLKEKTIESIKRCLGSEMCAEIKRHIDFELKSKLHLQTVALAIHHMSGMMLVLLASLLNPIAGVVAAMATGWLIFLIGQNVNSRAWRDSTALEIFKEISNKRATIVKELSEHLWKTFDYTSDDLKTVAEDLDTFRKCLAHK